MKAQVFSDIHMEHRTRSSKSGAAHPVWNHIVPSAPLAIVAGDIDTRNFEDTITEIASKFEKVICVYGNHEFYGKDIDWRPDLSKIPSNVSILDQSTCVYEDTVFIGTTLWTDFEDENFLVMDAANSFINDFKIVTANNGGTRFTAKMAADKFHTEKAWLKHTITENRGKKIVIVTHFLPSYALVHPRWKNPSTDLLNHYFSANCEDVIEMSEAAAWIFGHTHDKREMEIYDIPMYCNPLGYPNEGTGYTDMIIDI